MFPENCYKYLVLVKTCTVLLVPYKLASLDLYKMLQLVSTNQRQLTYSSNFVESPSNWFRRYLSMFLFCIDKQYWDALIIYFDFDL